MNYLVQKYISLLSPQLLKFRKKSERLYEFRCCYCGDSKRNPRRTRGNLYIKDGEWKFHCHKCNQNRHFEVFLKEQDERLFGEYLKEKLFKPKTIEIEPEATIPTFTKPGILNGLPKISDLPHYHYAYQYVRDRKLPSETYERLYFCEKFKEFTNNLIPEKLTSGIEEARLLIPLLDEDNQMFGFSGRSFKPDAYLRYVNIILDESKPKLFGIDKWKKGEKTFVVEGPLDSLFLPNCLSTCGGDMVAALRHFSKDKFVIVYDNEPRSQTTKKKIEKALNEGFSVGIWPQGIPFKDINDLILAGYEQESIIKMIHILSGLEGLLALKIYWSKC